MRSASRHIRLLPSDVPNLSAGFLGGDEEPEDLPWVAAFLTALEQRPTVAEAGWPEVCELLLERHVQEGTISSGEFYTPRTVARLLVDLASPQPGDRVLDPACGIGGLLATAVQRIAGSGRVDGASFEAYATDRSNLRLATMNLAIHGVDRPVVRASDPVALLQSRGNGLVDRVVSNPPFNQRIEDVDIAGWPFGRPPESNANFAWLQLAWARLSEDGIAVVVMPPRAAWSEGREAEIRRRMIADGVLLGVIALPPNLFTHTSIPVHIWLLAGKKSRYLPPGDTNAVLFIDASRLGTQVPRQPRVLAAADIERIGSRFHAWRRSPGEAFDEPGFSRSTTLKEILEHDGILDPRRYVVADEERTATALDLSSMIVALDINVETTSRSSIRLRNSLSTCERLGRSGTESPRVPLRSIVDGAFADSKPGLLLAGPSGSLIRAEDYVDDSGIPVVMPKDLTDDGFSVATIRHITERQAEELERFRIRLGDVVLARRGELGRCAVVREEQRGWVCGTGCFVLRPPDNLDAGYFAAYLRSQEARTWLEAHSTGSTTLKTISLNVLGELPVVLPDLGMQRAIADMAARMDDHERLLREQIASTRKVRRDVLSGLLGAKTVSTHR